MKRIIPINIAEGIARCLPAHYYKAGWHDFDPTSNIPHTAILEIMEDPKVEQTDNLCDSGNFGNPQRGRVYSTKGICPCLNGLDSGNNMPKIKVAATIDSGVGKWPTRQDDKIYDADGISPAIAACRTNHVPNIMEDPKTIQVAQIYDQDQNPMNGRVYSEDGISPTLRTPTGGLSEPCILTPIRTEEQRQLRKQGIDTFSGRQMCPRADGVSNTLTTVQKDNLLQEPCILGYSRDNKGKIVNFHEKELANTINTCTGSGGSMEQYVKEPMIQPLIPWNRPGEPTAISPTVTTSGWQDNNVVIKSNTAISYRIRKLTERECFRLMDMADIDIDKINNYRVKYTLKNGTVKEKPIPKTAKYKLAGNSIVVSCLYHIFRTLFIEDAPENKPAPTSKQYTIFFD